jgi:pimeloyl-ACP methyl ester carboxylesterase
MGAVMNHPDPQAAGSNSLDDLRRPVGHRWAVHGFKTQVVAVNGIAIHVAAGGRGSPVVLLHGYPQSGEIWRGIAPTLALRHLVIIPDLRGMGPPIRAQNHTVSRQPRRTQMRYLRLLVSGRLSSSVTTGAVRRARRWRSRTGRLRVGSYSSRARLLARDSSNSGDSIPRTPR